MSRKYLWSLSEVNIPRSSISKNWNKIVDNAYLQVSEEHLPPQQLDLPEYVQDVPEALPETAEEVKKMATMAVRDYQRYITVCYIQYASLEDIF